MPVHSMPRLAALSLTTLVCAMVAGGGCAEHGCTTEAVVSVAVSIVDDTGLPIPSAEFAAEYRADDDLDWTLCYSNEAVTIGSWSCGFEVNGDIEVRARSNNFTTETFVIHVSEGRCHVHTETLEITVSPL